MDVKKAYELITAKLPDFIIVTCHEYKTLFVFSVIHGSVKSVSGKTVANHMYSVNKKTGEIRDFKPFHIPIEEYKSGKEIKNFK